MFKILVTVSVVVALIAIIAAVIIAYRHSRSRDFDMTPRKRTGEAIDDESDDGDEEDDEDDEPDPVYEDDVTYDDWVSWEEFLQEVGVIDIRSGMIEYESGDNSRVFVMLAEMQQSNPALKSDAELSQQNAIKEVFYNGVLMPLKETSQSQRVEMNDFLNQVKEHSQYIRGSNDQMKEYAAQVIDDTLNYQKQTDRFENRAYLQFMAVVKPDEVYGDSARVLEDQIHEKAYEKLIRQIDRANSLLERAGNALAPLDNFGLLEVLYKTFNRDSSVKIRLEDIVKQQRYTVFTSAEQSDKFFKDVQQRIRIESEAVSRARDILLEQQSRQNDEKLRDGRDYYSLDADKKESTDSGNSASQDTDSADSDDFSIDF